MNFRLQIHLDYPTMQTGEDVAQALRKVGEELVQYDALTQRQHGAIKDALGNTVGNWKITRSN